MYVLTIESSHIWLGNARDHDFINLGHVCAGGRDNLAAATRDESSSESLPTLIGADHQLACIGMTCNSLERPHERSPGRRIDPWKTKGKGGGGEADNGFEIG